VTQVGLGTARNFTTARPIFQSLADNVPIACRALYEADWNINQKEEARHAFRKVAKQATRRTQVKAAKVQLPPTASSASESVTELKIHEKDMKEYFAEAPLAPVTSFLMIPLAPTPSARHPLPEQPSASQHPLLPATALSALHQDHTRHGLRVSSLFARLDAADVWARGAACDIYGDVRGAASVLRVRFSGWEAKEVRGIIGESGTGWCALEEKWDEERSTHDDDVDEALSQLSSDSGSDRGVVGESRRFVAAMPDPAQSFVLPTLDFSSSFPIASPFSDVPRMIDSFSSQLSSSSLSNTELDALSDDGSFSDGTDGWVDSSSPSPESSVHASTMSWLGFSSSFSERMEEGPREAMF